MKCSSCGFKNVVGSKFCNECGENLEIKCPDCGNAFLLEKTTKKTGTVRYCPNKECGHSSTLEPVDVETAAG